jgi:hypothetical protein
VKYQFIAAHQDEYPITRMCQALEVSVSGYYASRTRPVSQHQRKDARLAAEIQRLFLENRGCLWESAHSRGLTSTRPAVWTQKGGPADASPWLASQEPSQAQANHDQQ